uniref:Hemimethylated DNA-binding domain-containing protein n=1 Tax=Graphocephala atropunctata TaxID=36148 RepID=A0A1B6KDM2_9HEMI
MPLSYRDYFHLVILILCVPFQFYFSIRKDVTNTSKQVLELVNEVRNTKNNWFTFEAWKKTWTNSLSWFVINVLRANKEEELDESPAIEVLEYRKNHGIEDKSSKAHKARPPGLWFRVGQVVEHIYEGYKGVIVEWEFDSKKSNTPLYKILVDEDTADPSLPGVLNVEQDQLYLLKNTKVSNQLLKNYFSSFDGSQYIPRPWLQRLFPKD